MARRAKIGRNDPCPCGSRRLDGLRKKYKRCCIDRPSFFSPEFAHEVNERQMKVMEAERARFVDAHAKGMCYICSLPYDQYDPAQPCAHWLLRPAGMKKELVASVLEKYGCFRSQAFVRWLANAQAFGVQINDLSLESDPTKVFETTIVYKNFEWSYTCGNGDLAGHMDSTYGREPHFHFQMRIDGRPFIDYSDYHPILTDYDLFVVQAKRNELPGVVYREGFGAGMNDVMNMALDTELEGMTVSSNDADAQFNLQTLVQADPGTSISGDTIAKLAEESKRTGTPMAVLMRRLQNASVKTMIEPGPLVPEKASRTIRNR